MFGTDLESRHRTGSTILVVEGEYSLVANNGSDFDCPVCGPNL